MMRRTAIARHTSLRRVSAKRSRLNRERTEVLRPLRESQPYCSRCGRTGVGLDAHELVRRSQSSTSMVDASLIVLLCRFPCHAFVTENPAAAHAEGWVRWSWEAAS